MTPTPTWGIWAILEDEPHVLPDDMTGMDAIGLTELGDRLVSGCWADYWRTHVHQRELALSLVRAWSGQAATTSA